MHDSKKSDTLGKKKKNWTRHYRGLEVDDVYGSHVVCAQCMQTSFRPLVWCKRLKWLRGMFEILQLLAAQALKGPLLVPYVPYGRKKKKKGGIV